MKAFYAGALQSKAPPHGWGLTKAIFKQPRLLVFYANAFDLHGCNAAA